MHKSLEIKLKTLPRSPGVYFHKSASGEIIYVGKAAVLKNRVRQYFQNTRQFDAKTMALVAEIHDVDWTETESEIDALFLESEMVKRYMPRYNILLRDDKSQTFIRIDMKNEWPHVSFTRNPADDGADYFGPYYNGFAVKKALRYLRKVFPYFTKPPSDDRKADLDVHLGLSPGPDVTSGEYKANLRRLIRYFKGERVALVRELERDMKQAAKRQDFEAAAHIRNKINNLRELQRRIMFGDKEFLNISKDKALADLSDLLGLAKVPTRIEGYDISHMSGTNVVASMVVFTNGVSDRANYRKFKTRLEHNNDFYNMNETIMRRLSEKNLKSWGIPDLVIIDGGKGQLDAALQARDAREQANIPFIGLAKREEQIVIKNYLTFPSSSTYSAPPPLIPSKQISSRRTDLLEDSLLSAELASAQTSSTSKEPSGKSVGSLDNVSSETSGGGATGAQRESSRSTMPIHKYLQPEHNMTPGPGYLPGAKPLINWVSSESERKRNKVATTSNISQLMINNQKLQELDGYLTVTDDYTLINLPHNSHIVKLLQRIRDESHRFAVSYHTVLKRKKQTASTLEEIPGIGPSTRKKLIRTFGSLRGVKASSVEELAAAVGKAKAALLKQYLPDK